MMLQVLYTAGSMTGDNYLNGSLLKGHVKTLLNSLWGSPEVIGNDLGDMYSSGSYHGN